MKTIFLKGLCGLSLVMIPKVVFSSSKDNLKSVSPHQYTHLIETYQSQTFEPLSQTALFSEQSVLKNSYKTAGVYFLTKDKEQVFGSAGGKNTFEDPTIKQCVGEGYKYNPSNCPNGLPADTCPYNTGYFKSCCDVAYNYTEENCSLLNKSSSCGNKYKCDCTEEKYPVMANSCTSPQIPTTESGASCMVNGQIRYTKCVCPTGVNASYGCETYYAAPCDTVCKKAKSDNCDNRTAVQTPYGCEKYFTDCSSKCEKAYSDNCRNRIAVSAPNGCESYYADCSSKCEIASSEIKQEVSVGAIVYGDGTITQKVLSNKKPIGVVFDEENCLATALTNVKQNGSSGSEAMRWSTSIYDIPLLENCSASQIKTGTSDISINCGVDGRANTDKILACGSSCGTTPAATACNLYQPSGCTQDFCQSTKWFLPSIRDLQNIYANKAVLNTTLTSLKSSGAETLSEEYYWSSTESSSILAWNFGMKAGHGRYIDEKLFNTISASSDYPFYVRPAVAFCEREQEKIKQDISVGAIVYGDGTITKQYPLEGKTPVGIVFDVENSLAMATFYGYKSDNSNDYPQAVWAQITNNDSTDCNIPSLEDCTSSSSIYTCAVDGSKNTKAMISVIPIGCPYSQAAGICVSYQPSGCTKEFCQKNKWFLPSMRDLQNIAKNTTLIGATWTMLNAGDQQYFSRLIAFPVWSSNEYPYISTNGLLDRNRAWMADLRSGSAGMITPKYITGRIIPVVNFSELKE